MEITVYAELRHLVPLGVRLTAPNAPPRDYAACLGTAAGSTGPRTAGFVQKEKWALCTVRDLPRGITATSERFRCPPEV